MSVAGLWLSFVLSTVFCYYVIMLLCYLRPIWDTGSVQYISSLVAGICHFPSMAKMIQLILCSQFIPLSNHLRASRYYPRCARVYQYTSSISQLQTIDPPVVLLSSPWFIRIFMSSLSNFADPGRYLDRLTVSALVSCGAMNSDAWLPRSGVDQLDG